MRSPSPMKNARQASCSRVARCAYCSGVSGARCGAWHAVSDARASRSAAHSTRTHEVRGRIDMERKVSAPRHEGVENDLRPYFAD